VQAKGKPMIRYLLESVKKSGIDDKPIIVVGYKKEEVMKELGDSYDYVVQKDQLGTGHAVLSAENFLKDKTENVIVLFGDNPLIKPETLKKILATHLESNTKMTMGTTLLPDFADWRKTVFYNNFSRIVRNANGKIARDVQVKDATEEEKKITEVNPCVFCFRADWLWDKLKKLENDNAKKEYYLPSVLELAIKEGAKIETIEIPAEEAIGSNSKEELAIMERYI
jgi:bifunctional N-acetylglucosamine-1-phosphate-uridyltransferase/glucosamine-1-phosphate-acetyltransferase GlmU-like protein